jgi:general secretion pathway protein D
MAEIEKAEKTEPEVRPVYPPARWRQKEFLTKEREIAARMKTGKQYFLTGEYDKSKDFYESVMREDPENTEAIRMLHKIMEIKERVAIQEREMTRDGMITDARKAWNRRDYAETGELGEMRTNTVGGVRPPPDEVVRQQILAKMEKIILPEIDFKQAFIRDVIDFLSKQSQEHDKAEADGASKGVNIVLNLAAGAQPKTDAAPAVSDPFVTQPPTGQAPAAGSENVNLITFQARGISLLEALKIVCSVANLKYRVEGSIVMVLPLDAPESKIVHRMYDVLPSFVTRMNEMKNVFGGLAGPGGAPGAPAPGAPPGGVGGEQDLKAMFAGFGIAWPQGSSIQHVPQIGKLIVANTVDNLATFEKVLGVLNVVPAQIEIEARFVEVRQTDIESLGFEWLLNDNWEIMQRRGMADLPANQRQRVVIGADSADGGMTSGNRFMRSGAMLPASAGNINDNLLHVSSVLTNPELTMILHAMQQKGNADLLSAPKVTTKTASEATIKVVREYIYPTEFTVTPIMGTTAGAGIATIVGGVVEPASFETREVGVILSVMPEVTPDGQMIDLTMTPQVVDEPEWENYGSEYTAPDGSVTRLPMRQPIFKSRSVQTSLSIYNGSTVVLGGMINEIRTAVDDKIPLLGDLPLIGRLFRSQYEHSDKRNLLIFVTARLVDPGGRAITPTEKTMNRLIPGLSQSSSK